jgi:hypothetical protein
MKTILLTAFTLFSTFPFSQKIQILGKTNQFVLLIIDKLLRIKQLNFYYFELGVSIFARYGTYSFLPKKIILL